jgi:hypothetical protein
MQALKKFSAIITLAALSLYGSSAWAQDSFVAKATLNGANVVPSVLSVFKGELCLTISEPPTTTAQAIGPLQRRRRSNPWQINFGGTGILFGVPVRNVRVYFGQSFANGQPILTLCDDDIKVSDDTDEDECPEVIDDRSDVKGPNFDLNSIQFQREQIDENSRNPSFGLVDKAGRLRNDLSCEESPNNCGFLVIKRLIEEQGLIYVVVNSDFKAKKRKDGTIKYKPPKGRLVVDGDFRGTLSIDERLDECPFTPPPQEEE